MKQVNQKLLLIEYIYICLLLFGAGKIGQPTNFTCASCIKN